MNKFVFDPEVLRAARTELERDHFTVTAAPPDLLEQGIALTAYRQRDDFGAVIAFAELGHVCHYGACYLWAGVPASDPPAWQQRDVRQRLEAYVSKVCSDVATSPHGLHQETLHRAAWILGGLVGSGALEETATVNALERAGLETGMDPNRVAATVKRSVERGKQAPWAFTDRPRVQAAGRSLEQRRADKWRKK
jgi:hypothetical protein